MKRQAFLGTIAASTVAMAPMAALAQWHPDVRWGWVVSVQGSSFTLRDGTTVFLHQGTVILPTGAPIRAGQRVHIFGQWDGRKRINADKIVIRG